MRKWLICVEYAKFAFTVSNNLHIQYHDDSPVTLADETQMKQERYFLHLRYMYISGDHSLPSMPATCLESSNSNRQVFAHILWTIGIFIPSPSVVDFFLCVTGPQTVYGHPKLFPCQTSEIYVPTHCLSEKGG